MHEKYAYFVKEFLKENVKVLTYPSVNFEVSYLSEFLRYDLRKKCVWKPLMHTFWKLTCGVTQNILRATTTEIV